MVPTSLFTAITETSRTDVVERVGQAVEVDRSGRVDGHHPPAEVLDRVQHGVVLGRGAHRRAAVAADRAEHGQVVGLGAAAGEDHLAGLRSRGAAATTSRASSSARRASRDAAWEPLGLAKRSVRNGSIASTASGRMGVVAA